MTKIFNYLQNIGRALMVPVAVLPAAAILLGLGYWLDPVGWGADNQIAALLIKSGSALIDNMGILFAIGVGFGLSKDKNGAAALSALVGWLVIQTLLSPDNYALIVQINVEEVPAAFSKINNQFIGILTGIVASTIYNKTYQVELHQALSFFGGRRLSSIVTAASMVLVSAILMIVWPTLYNALVSFGEMLMSMGPLGAGIFGTANRLLIPFGLHHALYPVFWFDVAGINDIANFYAPPGTVELPDIEGYTIGMYLAGFFPIMMFGLPAGALAMYHEALPSQKSKVKGLFLAAGFVSFFTGVTEPLEFSFMFAAPGLYVLHAIFTGLSLFIAASMQWISGFSFSAGFIDFVLSTKNANANQWYMLLIQGLFFACLYYFSFRFAIRKFNIKTPGRDAEENEIDEKNEENFTGNKHEVMAQKLLRIIGDDNLVEIDNCATRLRLIVKTNEKINVDAIKRTGVAGVIKPSDEALQIIVGPAVEFVADEMKKIHHKSN